MLVMEQGIDRRTTAADWVNREPTLPVLANAFAAPTRQAASIRPCGVLP